MNRIHKKKSGFTVVEILVGVFIFSIIALIMSQFFIQGSRLWHVLTFESDLRSIARNAMEYMTSELKQTTRRSPPTPPSISIPSKPNNNSIHFYLPYDLDGNDYIFDELGNTEWDTSNKIQYQYVPGLKQLRRLEKGSFRIIATDVTLIEFKDNSIDSTLNKDELRIILTISKNIPLQGMASVTLSSNVKLRN